MTPDLPDPVERLDPEAQTLVQRGVWHKDGPLAQIECMARWADEPCGDPTRNRDWETAQNIGKNLRAALSALPPSEEPPEITDSMVAAGAKAMFEAGNERLGVERDFDDPAVGPVYTEEARLVLNAALRRFAGKQSAPSENARLREALEEIAGRTTFQEGVDLNMNFVVLAAEVNRLARSALHPSEER